MNNSEADGLGRALTNAGAALDAVALINLGSTISNSDGTNGASTDAALAADAFLFVNLSSHFFLLVNGCRGSKSNSTTPAITDFIENSSITSVLAII